MCWHLHATKDDNINKRWGKYLTPYSPYVLVHALPIIKLCIQMGKNNGKPFLVQF